MKRKYYPVKAAGILGSTQKKKGGVRIEPDSEIPVPKTLIGRVESNGL